jgi:hypothetical protein
MNNLLIAIAVFIITVVGALFAVPYFVDWNSYRANFEEEASRIVGRGVEVDGDVTLHLLPTPYFRLEKVRIADPSADLTFFKADSLSIRLSIPPMFRGIVEANEIEFQRPVLRLAIDKQGAWNWQSFAQALGAGGYLPSNVTLTSLKIVDGVLALHGPDGLEQTRLEGLNGELSAPALEGPYRFRGVFVTEGAAREVRLATSPPEADGRVPVRASLRLMDTAAHYLLEARLADLMGNPRVEGDLTARLPIAGLWQPIPQGGALSRVKLKMSREDEDKLDKSEAAFDLKAVVRADAGGAELSDLSMTFEQGGRPQIVTGSVRASWRSERALQMSMSSRWLDLDRITGSTEDAGPIESITKFASRLRDFIPGRGRAEVTLVVDQANLGRDLIGPVRLLLRRSEEKLDIQDLKVALPGGSRAELQGSIYDTARNVVFDGRLALRGASVARFLTWATGNAVPIEAKADGAFGLRAQIGVGDGKVAAGDIVGNLSGTTLSGTALYRWAGRPELAVTLEGPQIDARSFIPAGASLADVYSLLLRDPALTKAEGQPARRVQPDVSLRISAGQLATGGRVYRDVAAALELKGGHLRELRLRVSGDEGYKLEVEGSVADVASRPKGSLRGLALADTAQGLTLLAELLGAPHAFWLLQDRGPAIVPLRLAGSMTFGSRTAGSADLVLDGSAGGASVRLDARLNGGAGGWRTGRADVTATVQSADGAKVAKLVLPGSVFQGSGAGRLVFKAVGVPDQGLATLVSLDAGDLALGFRGQTAPEEAGINLSGEVDFRTGDAAPLFALVGLSPPLSVDGVPMNGKLELHLADGKFRIDELAANVAGSRLAGSITLSRGTDRNRVDASLDTDEVSVAGLLAVLLEQKPAVARIAESAIAGHESIWPDDPFSAAAFDAFEGNIELTSKRLRLTEGVGLDRVKLDVALSRDRIDVNDVSGLSPGGAFKGKLHILRAPAGAELRGDLTFDASLEALAGGAAPQASGPVSGTLKFSGRGLSPRSLVLDLKGAGKIAFGEVKLAALWPGAIPLAADAGLKAQPDQLADTVRRGLLSRLPGANLPIGQKAVALELSDSQLRVESFAVDTREGRATGTASVDLRTLHFDSQWRLQAKAGTAGKQLPAVTVTYSGPVAALGTIEPRIDSSALEQELAARRIERDVEELERLRRLDEQRRQTESERLRKQFDQTPPVPRPPLPVAPSSREPRPATPG